MSSHAHMEPHKTYWTTIIFSVMHIVEHLTNITKDFAPIRTRPEELPVEPRADRNVAITCPILVVMFVGRKTTLEGELNRVFSKNAEFEIILINIKTINIQQYIKQ